MGNPAECRINLMPDSILHHVLCFLPIKDAVRSSTLSKRWRYLYTAIPVVEFNADDFLKPMEQVTRTGSKCVNCGSQHAINFFEVVDQFLLSHVSCLRRFSLQVTLIKESEKRRFGRWLRHLTAVKKVEELSLAVDGLEDDLPLHLFNRLSLLHLKLEDYHLQVDGVDTLPILKSLHLHDVIHARDSHYSTLNMCPNLESLTFQTCDGTTDMQISANHLTSLRIVESQFLSLEIVAPSLQSFEFDCLDNEGIVKLHGDVDRVKILKACACVFEAFYKDDGCGLHQFNELEVLIARSCWTSFLLDLYIASVLKRSPNLRVLCIERKLCFNLSGADGGYQPVGCILPRLRVANFKSLTCKQKEVMLLKHFIRCAPSLEDLRITFDPVDRPEMARVTKELLCIQRRYPLVNIDFTDCKNEAVVGVGVLRPF